MSTLPKRLLQVPSAVQAVLSVAIGEEKVLRVKWWGGALELEWPVSAECVLCRGILQNLGEMELRHMKNMICKIQLKSKVESGHWKCSGLSVLQTKCWSDCQKTSEPPYSYLFRFWKQWIFFLTTLQNLQKTDKQAHPPHTGIGRVCSGQKACRVWTSLKGSLSFFTNLRHFHHFFHPLPSQIKVTLRRKCMKVQSRIHIWFCSLRL